MDHHTFLNSVDDRKDISEVRGLGNQSPLLIIQKRMGAFVYQGFV